MSTPHKCPVCNGSGKVSRPPWVAGDQETWSDNTMSNYDCTACENGIVWEGGDSEPNALVGTYGFEQPGPVTLSHEQRCSWRKVGTSWTCPHNMVLHHHPNGYCDQGCCR